MSDIPTLSRIGSLGVVALMLAVGAMSGCQQSESNRIQGYVEGEYIYVAAPSAGALQALYVSRGMQVSVGTCLFALDSIPEKAARDEAERRVAAARANWEDAKKGKRPSEMDSLTAQLEQAKAALALSERNLARREKLLSSGGASKEDIDLAQVTRDQDRQRVAQLQADLETARLGARRFQIVAAEANVRVAAAALAKAEWDLAQKHQSAPQSGLVYDTLFRQGEWVAAGRPVVALLPPENIKVRAFVPEPRIGAIQVGQQMRVYVDGVAQPFLGNVTYISPQAEYTPPVIYSRESRSKLVFLVELRFDPEAAGRLHPGQPVDVDMGPAP
jgi:HlyD family secretion protein